MGPLIKPHIWMVKVFARKVRASPLDVLTKWTSRLNQHHLLRKSPQARMMLSTESSATNAFDRSFKRLQRDNAARLYQKHTPPDEAIDYDYFRNELATRLIDRLDDIRRDEGFPLALDIGSGSGYIYRAICADDALQESGGGIGGVRKLVQMDWSELQLHRAGEDEESKGRCDTYRMVLDEESHLPFPDGTFDLVTSCGSIHWVNKLPTLLKEVRRVLKPDGCFLWAMVGGADTLSELRASLALAEQERDGGVSPHVGPFVQLTDVGSLLQNAGFALPTIDTDTIRVAYPNAAVLMEHLQRMGEGNACLKRKDRTSLNTLLAATSLYDSLFATTENDGTHAVEASVHIIYAIGWSPHESQQQPKARGSATHKVGDIAIEVTKGDQDP